MEVREYLLVDGYNIIFTWAGLRALANESLDAARTKLADILCNYQGFKRCEVILVFDGYKTKGNPGSMVHYNNIDIVYTKEAQTADQFIEMLAQQMGRKCFIRVATSDAVEQVIILGKGAVRMSARELEREVAIAEQDIRRTLEEKRSPGRSRLFDHLDPELAKELEKMRLKPDDE